jgi:hypothetical protein
MYNYLLAGSDILPEGKLHKRTHQALLLCSGLKCHNSTKSILEFALVNGRKVKPHMQQIEIPCTQAPEAHLNWNDAHAVQQEDAGYELQSCNMRLRMDALAVDKSPYSDSGVVAMPRCNRTAALDMIPVKQRSLSNPGVISI